ncbi:MAG: M3 family oligoendopeptidase [Lachnospiraceae bacterium]|nr:M3 family oligoendopeptidase [Lachnospiraceae bacterium]
MNNTTWNLDTLYTSFSSEKFLNDYNRAKDYIEEIDNWCKLNLKDNSSGIEKTEYYINFMNNFGEVISLLLEYCQLTLSTDAENEIALKTLESLEELETEITPSQIAFEHWFASQENAESIIIASPLLSEHSFYLNQILTNSKYLLSQNEEVIIAKMRNTGSLAWMKLWDILSSTLSVSINDKSYPLAEVRNMAYSNNAEIRKTAYESELKALKSIAPSSAAALNGIKGEVITNCKMCGYSSPLEMTLLDSRIDKPVLDAMISAMKEYQPIFRKYFQKKAEILGHKNGLPFYDIFAPVGTVDMQFSYDEAKVFIIENFSLFSKELGDYAKRAFDNRWIDVFPKEGKRGGAFCSNLHSIKESRILTNFSGNFNDVITLAHELGHGYHGECLNNETHLNSDYPMPIAETASTFCETLVKNAALKNATPEQQEIILENDISDSAQIVVDILSRFLFEDAVFEERKNGSLSEKELCTLMINAQKQTYGDGLDENFMHPYMWVVKPHYYDVDYNYYNFPYAFGLLFAKGLYGIYLEKGSAFSADYVKLLRATGKANLRDIALMVNIDISHPEFWRSSLNIIKEDIENYIKS